jgi:putative salt-induced outer membrane protein
MRSLVSAVVPATLFGAPAAQAQWSGKTELGLLFASGNTESKSANTKIDLAHEGSRWRNKLYFSALYGENAEFATGERYEAQYQADWKINDRLSWFGRLRGEQDRFSGFAYQTTLATGATFLIIDSPATEFDISIGAGYRRLQSQILLKSDAGEVLARIDGDIERDPVATLTSKYEHAFTENTKLTNKLLAESGADDTAVQNDIELSVSMTTAFALAVGFGVRYNTDPPPLAESTDTVTTVNLVYNIL